MEVEWQHAVLVLILVSKKHTQPRWTDSSRFTTVPGIQTSLRVALEDVVCSKFSKSKFPVPMEGNISDENNGIIQTILLEKRI